MKRLVKNHQKKNKKSLSQKSSN